MDFNKSIHKIHNLSCITLWLVLLVCWFFFKFKFKFKFLIFYFLGVKLREVVIIFNIEYCKKGESFH